MEPQEHGLGLFMEPQDREPQEHSRNRIGLYLPPSSCHIPTVLLTFVFWGPHYSSVIRGMVTAG